MLSLLRLAGTALFLCFAASTAGMADQPRLQIGNTVFLGGHSPGGDVSNFLGIPFAAPPVGKLRWSPPQSVSLRAGERQATTFAAACFQGPHMVEWYRGVVSSFGGDPAVFAAPQFDEDCLYLNVWAPTDQGEELLPVMVYVHGGSNKGGWSYEPNYIGENLARRDVVVISIAYRLGVLGFFSHPLVSQSNFALLDIIAALQWVQGNVSKVGGDPENVTIFGESSGASNIAFLMGSPAADGLFGRVIHQSAGWAASAKEYREQHMALGERLAHAATGEPEDIEGLRMLPVDELFEHAKPIYASKGYDPVIDGHTLQRPLAKALEQGETAAVDLLVGTNANEWLMYLDGSQALDRWLITNVPTELQEEVLSELGESADEAHSLDRLITAEAFVCPSMRLAQGVENSGAKAWFYFFSRQREGEQAAAMGAYHGAELPYVFDTHDDWLPTQEVDRVLTQDIMSAWVNFARNGNPNGEGLVSWPPYNAASQRTMVIDASWRVEQHRDARLCGLLESIPRE